MPRSDNESSAPTVGANVMIYFKDELLAKVHLLHLQVPWSAVGELYSEAAANEKQGMMSVDIAQMRRDGHLLFDDNFSAYYKDVFTKRFIPCLLEMFNQKPITNLPGDVSEALRLLVVCERFKAVMKQDVKAHLESLLDRSLQVEDNRNANESTPYRVYQTSMDLDVIAPPKGSLQELVVNRSLEMLTAKLPDSLPALCELHMLASEMHRHEMSQRLFKATTRRAMDIGGAGGVSGNIISTGGSTLLSAKREAEKNEENAKLNGQESERLRVERDALDKERERLRMEAVRLDVAAKQQQQHQAMSNGRTSPANHNNQNSRENSFSVNGTFRSNNNNNYGGGECHNTSGGTFSNSGNGNGYNEAVCGVLSLRQGLLLTKIGRQTGSRIVRLNGDTLEWRKEYGSFTRDHSISQRDVINVKTTEQNSFSIVHKAGILTLRALSDQSAALFAQAVDHWVRGRSTNFAASSGQHASAGAAGTQRAMASAPSNNGASTTMNRMSVVASSAPPMASMRMAPPAPSSSSSAAGQIGAGSCAAAANSSTTANGTMISRRFSRMSFNRPATAGGASGPLTAAMMASAPPMPRTTAPLDLSFGSTGSA